MPFWAFTDHHHHNYELPVYDDSSVIIVPPGLNSLPLLFHRHFGLCCCCGLPDWFMDARCYRCRGFYWRVPRRSIDHSAALFCNKLEIEIGWIRASDRVYVCLPTLFSRYSGNWYVFCGILFYLWEINCPRLMTIECTVQPICHELNFGFVSCLWLIFYSLLHTKFEKFLVHS